MLFRPSARAVRCAARAIEILDAAGRGGRDAARRAAGHARPDARRLAVPLPPPGRRLHLDDRRAEGRRRDPSAGKPCIGVGAGQRAGLRAPQRRPADGRRRHPDLQDVRRLGDLPRRADDASSTTRSTTSSLAEFARMGARVLGPEDVGRLAGACFAPDGSVQLQALGQSCVNLGAHRGLRCRRRGQGADRAAADRPRRSWPPIRSCARS